MTFYLRSYLMIFENFVKPWIQHYIRHPILQTVESPDSMQKFEFFFIDIPDTEEKEYTHEKVITFWSSI